jgi:hypothetical protein
MYLRDQGNGRAIRLSTDKLSADDKPRWIRMDYFEYHFLVFIGDLKWREILGEAELREALTNAANLKLAIEQEQQRVASIGQALIKSPSSDYLAGQLAEAETKLAALEDELPAAEAWQVELEARHAALLDDSTAFKKLAGATDAATRMQLQAEIRRKVKSITFNFKGRMNLNPEWDAFPADKPQVVCWIEFVNGAKRGMKFTPDRVGVFWSTARTRRLLVRRMDGERSNHCPAPLRGSARTEFQQGAGAGSSNLNTNLQVGQRFFFCQRSPKGEILLL